MITNKLIFKYVKLIRKGRMTRVEVNSFRKALGHCSSLNADEKNHLLNEFRVCVETKGGIRIDRDHTKRGITYLRQLAFTKTGKMRNTKNYPFGDRECDIIRNFKRFLLVHLEPQYNGMGDILEYKSVWQVQGGSHTTFFEYIQRHMWDGIEVVS